MNEMQVLFVWLDLGATTILVGGFAYAVFVASPQPRGRHAIQSACLSLGVALVLEISLNAT